MKTPAQDDPARLRSLLERGSVLERGLEAAHAAGPTDEQLEALERSVLAGVGVATAVGVAGQVGKTHAAAHAASWLSASTTKLLMLVAAAGAGSGALVARHVAHGRSHGETVRQSSTLPAHTRPAQSVEALPAEMSTREHEAPADSVAMPKLGASAEPASPALKRRVAKESMRAGAQSSPMVDNEMQLLKQAGEALAGAPATALALADDHRRRFPGSVMDQERELIAIRALVNLGRSAEARERAKRFSRTHAGSVYQAQIEAAIEGSK